MPATETRVPVEALRDFGQRLLVAAGVRPEDAAMSLEVLLAAGLRGVDSHGVAHLPRITEHIENGVITPAGTLRLEHEE